MSNKTKDEKSLTVITKPDAPTAWGDRDQIAALGNRLKVMLPGGEKLNNEQAMALAQYSQIADANPFRGEIYAMVDWRGQVTFVEGYKLIVRWAKSKCNYTDTYRELPPEEKVRRGLNEGDIAFTCFILRDDQKDMIREFVGLGATFREAYEMVATSATGVVTVSDRTSKKGEPIDPPKGWTWEDVAKKRALKNALNLSHGAPSPRELAEASWNVNGQRTTPEDWESIPAHILKYQVLTEQYTAQLDRARHRQTADEMMTETEHAERLQDNIEVLRGNGDDDPIGESDKERFAKQVIKEITFYTSQSQVYMALLSLALNYDPENEEMLLDELAKEANRQADKATA